MRVTILPDRRIEEMEPATVAEVLKRLGLHSDAYLVVRDDEILTRDVRLRAEDAVDVIPVISGGRLLPARPEGPSGAAGGGGASGRGEPGCGAAGEGGASGRGEPGAGAAGEGGVGS